jgi:leucyl-tRNA synthetase
LSNLNCTDGNKWPKIDEKVLENTKINMVVQVNGKTRDVLNIKKNLNETEINRLIMKSSKANKHLVNKTIIKTIFVKNKIINYIIKN